MRKLFILLFCFCAFSSQAALLDKIVAVVNDNVITLSQVKRVEESLSAIKTISPQLYSKPSYNVDELVKVEVKRTLIREKLTEMGYVVSDDQVESQIKSTEKRLGLNRSALLEFLKTNGFTFDEYFELIRGSIEYNLFISRVIQPLISITEQDIKNSYYTQFKNKKRLSFKYNLVDFSHPKSQTSKTMLSEFKNVLTSYQESGNLPEAFSNVATNPLGELSEDGLTRDIKSVLSSTNEKEFSEPILLGSDYHIFYVKNKELIESEDYLEKKNQIQSQLFQKSINTISESWYKSEADKHYIKYFL